MKTSLPLLRRFAQFFSLVVMASLLPCAHAYDEDPPPSPVVSYNPPIKSVEGLAPYSLSYDIVVTSPTLPINYIIPGVLDPFVTPVTINLNAALTSTPPSSGPNPNSFLTISGPAVTYSPTGVPQVTFTAPGQSRTITVTVAIPSNTPPTSTPYAYKISTSGWPATMLARLVTLLVPLTDIGTFVNASVTDPGVSYTKPVANITVPADAAQFTVDAANIPTYAVDFTAVFTSTGAGASQISSPPVVEVTRNGSLVQLTNVATVTDAPTTGFQKTTTGKILAREPGTYTITARATNAGGTSDDDVSSFTVRVNAAPPTVVINTPAPNATYTYNAGGPAVAVPFTFTARSAFGGIRTLTAKVDGANVIFTPSGLNTLTATGSITDLSYTIAGTHTLEVTTTDDYGTATTSGSFTVNVVTPTPTIEITLPADNAVINIPSGASTVNVPFSFKTNTTSGFTISAVSASLNGSPTAITATTGLNTAAAVSTGTLTNVGPGSHTLVATGISSGITVTDTVNFTVKQTSAAPQPPTVVINTPPAGSTYTRVSGAAALSIPLTFTGSSVTPGAVITNLTASLNGSSLTVTKTNLNTATATGAATLSVTNAGTYTISVSAVDAYGTASATRTFVVSVVQGRTISGDAFFDIDFDGYKDCDEFGLSGIAMKLINAAGQVVATDDTDSCGNYSFCNIGPGTYKVSATAPAGLKGTTAIERTVTVGSSNVCVPDMGFGLNFTAIRTMTANGFTIGYWKNNLDKAIEGKTSGIQVSKTTLTSYTTKIADFALSPYDCISLKTASSTMGYNGSNSASLLSKQLIASEYNYQNAAYLSGNKTLTFLFLYWGEYVLKNTTKYSDSYRIWAKDWFDAYNNSHGGVVAGPAS